MVLTRKEEREARIARKLREEEKEIKRQQWVGSVLYLVSLCLLIVVVSLVLIKRQSHIKGNRSVLNQAKDAYMALNEIEKDIVFTANYFQIVCPLSVIYERTQNGFVYKTVEHKSQIMKVQKGVKRLTHRAMPVLLGNNIKEGDELILCNETGSVGAFKVSAFVKESATPIHYIISEDPIGDWIEEIPGDLYAIKLQTIEYQFEKKDILYDLKKIQGDKETYLHRSIVSHDIQDQRFITKRGPLVISLEALEGKGLNQSTVKVVRKIPWGDVGL